VPKASPDDCHSEKRSDEESAFALLLSMR